MNRSFSLKHYFSVLVVLVMTTVVVRGDPPFVEGRLLVKPKASVSAEKMGGEHKKFGVSVERTFKRVGNLQLLRLPKGVTVAEALEFYRKSGLIEYAEPDYVVSIATNPDDPKYQDGTQWGMNNTGQNGGASDADIDAPEAWDTRTDASTIIVAVVDTGVRYTHEDLSANMWRNPGETGLDGFGNDKATNGIDDDSDGLVDNVYGCRFIGATITGNPNDDHGHGSHCAGIIGAVGNNGKGVTGVCWNVQIMACKFLDNTGNGAVSDAVKCIDFARTHGAKVISNSWGGGGFAQSLSDAISSARSAGILFIAAAGNGGGDGIGDNNSAAPFYPSSYNFDNVISVAATDRNDQIATFSNYSSATVHLGAPGVSIYSTHNPSDTGYTTMSGTSMACPHVSGACALVWAQFPSATYSEIKARILGTTDPIPSLTGKTTTGGRLNVARALTLDPLPDFTANPLSGILAPLTVTFTDKSSGTITSRTWDFGDGSATLEATNASHTYTTTGDFNVTLTVTGPNGTNSKTRVISVIPNYNMLADTFSWIDPSAMTGFTMTDDAVSASQTLPFTFTFYGQNYTQLFISSNGMLGFTNANLTTFANADMPTAATPNNIIAPYWDDLDPSAGGTARFGISGTAPNRIAVVSWVGVPPFGATLTSATLAFQVLLFEGSGDIKMQFLEVQPGNATVGAGRSATVGVESASGTVAKKYSFNGGTLLTNNQAILFTIHPPAIPQIAIMPASHDYGTMTVGESADFVFAVANNGSAALSGSVTANAPFTIISGGNYNIATGATSTVTVRFSPNVAGLFADTLTFTGGGGTTAAVVGFAQLPAQIAVSPALQDFGLLSIGEVADREFVVTNTGSAALTGGATVETPFTIVSGDNYTLSGGESATVTVRFAPNNIGIHNGTVAFSGGGGTTTAVAGSAQLPAQIAVTPALQNYGDVIIGQSADREFIVTNTGSAALTGNATVSAPFSIVSGGNYTLSGGESATVTMRFAPNSGEIYNGAATFGGGGGTTAAVVGVCLAPDLAVESFTLNKNSFSIAETATATITVKNRGSLNTVASYWLSLHVNKPDSVDCNAGYNKRITCPALTAGASETFTIGFVLSSAEGHFTLRAFADHGCVITESSETNNQATHSYTVIGQTDLSIESMTLNKTAYLPGETGTATITMKNRGVAATKVWHYLDLHVDAPASLECGASGWHKHLARPPQAAGASYTMAVSFMTPPTPGTHTLRLFADATCALFETDETNNQATHSYAVTGPPDLSIESMTLNKGTYSPGETGTVTVTVKNRGLTATKVWHYLDLHLDASASLGCSVGGWYKHLARPTQAVGASYTMAIGFIVPATEGSYTLRIFADALCAVLEGDENNNQSTLNYTVSSAVGASISNDGTPTNP